ncbi:transcriptional regulator, TetR family [Natronincola peptidivorans]|uniref:Transcriptional regulator, TetR family n=1 Tax=Natronincola peptidivorans TaxID=426128 RepID=A0A1I0GDQ8_9FIRM|nr:TetR/AcrR family transcriptional regulator [Natronincola peptidivorans]SET68270.1 transcriptional regulator, TetR family [Natronincola peptidivorans]
MYKRKIQKRRMMSYFIEAANQIIEEEGMEGVTVRKVADLAGYNSATLYNYFENLDHLIFFASMKYLKEYAISLPQHVKNTNNSLDKYFAIWECFCYHSYNRPKVYQAIFFNEFSSLFKNAIKEYYCIFPNEIGEQSEELLPMLLSQNIVDRNLSILKTCASEGLIPPHHLEDINEMTLLVYEGMFLKVANGEVDYSVEEAVERTLKFIKQIIYSYCESACSNTSGKLFA